MTTRIIRVIADHEIEFRGSYATVKSGVKLWEDYHRPSMALYDTSGGERCITFKGLNAYLEEEHSPMWHGCPALIDDELIEELVQFIEEMHVVCKTFPDVYGSVSKTPEQVREFLTTHKGKHIAMEHD